MIIKIKNYELSKNKLWCVSMVLRKVLDLRNEKELLIQQCLNSCTREKPHLLDRFVTTARSDRI